MNVEIDKLHLLALAGDDREVVRDILEEFYKNSSDLVGLVSKGIDGSDSKLVFASVHQLKGSSGMLGMTSLCELCKQLESKGIVQLDESLVRKLRKCLLESYQLAIELLVG